LGINEKTIMIRSFLIAILFLTLISCSDDRDNLLFLCTDKSSPNSEIDCSENLFDPEIHCRQHSLGPFLLQDGAQDFYPYRCREISEITFINDNGTQVSMEVFRSHTITPSYTNVPCDPDDIDNEEFIQLCMQRETISGFLRNEILEFFLSLSPIIAPFDTSGVDIADNIFVGVKNNPSSNQFFGAINIVTNQRNGGTPFNLSDFLGEVELNGRVYEEVYYANAAEINPDVSFEIYYSKVYGIVSYVDSNDIQWYLNTIM